MTGVASRIEFFFDISSPWTYLAFSQIETLAERCGAELEYRPIIVGGVFNAVNQQLYETRAAMDGPKLAYTLKDLQDWADLYGLVITWPDVFPLNAVKLMRGALIAQAEGCLRTYAQLAFERYWGQGADLSQMADLRDLATTVGLDADTFEAGLADETVKAALRANTDELIARGGFGSPTVFVDETDMFFGNDRLHLIAAKLTGKVG